MKIHIWDVAPMYLFSEVPEAALIYLRPIEGLEVPTNIPHKRPLVLKLKECCVHELRSSGSRWNQMIDAGLEMKGFRQSSKETCTISSWARPRMSTSCHRQLTTTCS